MNTHIPIEIFGHANAEICASCEGHDCSACSAGEKTALSELVAEFKDLLERSELGALYTAELLEATADNLSRNPDVERLLSMAQLEPVICIGGKISYLGGFSPQGLLDELRKKHGPTDA